MDAIQKLPQLQDHPVLRIFSSITEIARPTGGEAAMADWVLAYAAERNWPWQQDGIGNVFVSVPASAGCESLPSLCLQAHLDMVCVDADGKVFGAERFPLQLAITDGWLTADGTTLGADNGIGVALALAAASEVEHGPLELLFTVAEEGGLDGAKACAFPLQSKMLLNLDSEDWGELFIGCAGGFGATLEAPLSVVDSDTGSHTYRLTVEGLQGGHSGLEIHKARENAIQLLAYLLVALHGQDYFRLVNITAGSRTNAIPASAEVTFMSGEANPIGRSFEACNALLARLLSKREPNLRLSCTRVDWAPKSVSAPVSSRVVELLQALPHGVLAMSEMPGIPETSINLAIAELDVSEQSLVVQLMGRSSANAKLGAIRASLEEQCLHFRRLADVPLEVRPTFSEGYPGWQPEPASGLVTLVQNVWSQHYQEPLHVTAVHAGLECGILKGTYPDVEMASFGPDIRGAHSPEERVNLASVGECYTFLQHVLTSIR